MGKLREILRERYGEHYARVNPTTDPRSLPFGWHADVDLTFGQLLADVDPDGRVLDLGCGTGFLLSWLAGKPVMAVGIDDCVEQLAVARRSMPRVELVCDDGLAYLKKHAGEFRGIFCMDVLEHIPDEDVLLEWVQTAIDALRPGGFFCCRVPNAANLTGAYGRYVDLTHARAFTRASILQLLEAAGLQRLRIVPQRAARWRGRVRLRLEALIHRALFRIANRPPETVFTMNVCVAGFKPET